MYFAIPSTAIANAILIGRLTGAVKPVNMRYCSKLINPGPSIYGCIKKARDDARNPFAARSPTKNGIHRGTPCRIASTARSSKVGAKKRLMNLTTKETKLTINKYCGQIVRADPDVARSATPFVTFRCRKTGTARRAPTRSLLPDVDDLPQNQRAHLSNGTCLVRLSSTGRTPNQAVVAKKVDTWQSTAVPLVIESRPTP